MVTASDGSGDLLVVSSEIIIRSAHRSTSSNLGATGTLVQGDSYPSLMRLNAGYGPYGRLAPRLLLLHIPAPPLQLQRQQHTCVLAMEMVGGDANGGIGVGCVVVGGARVTRVQALEPGGDKEATCALPEGSHVQEEDVEAEDGGKMVAKDPGMYGDPPARVADQVGPSRSASTNKSASYTDQIRCLCNAPSVMIVGRFVLSLVLRYTRLCVSLLENGTLSTAALSRRL